MGQDIPLPEPRPCKREQLGYISSPFWKLLLLEFARSFSNGLLLLFFLSQKEGCRFAKKKTKEKRKKTSVPFLLIPFRVCHIDCHEAKRLP